MIDKDAGIPAGEEFEWVGAVEIDGVEHELIYLRGRATNTTGKTIPKNARIYLKAIPKVPQSSS